MAHIDDRGCCTPSQHFPMHRDFNSSRRRQFTAPRHPSVTRIASLTVLPHLDISPHPSLPDSAHWGIFAPTTIIVAVRLEPSFVSHGHSLPNARTRLRAPFRTTRHLRIYPKWTETGHVPPRTGWEWECREWLETRQGALLELQEYHRRLPVLPRAPPECRAPSDLTTNASGSLRAALPGWMTRGNVCTNSSYSVY